MFVPPKGTLATRIPRPGPSDRKARKTGSTKRRLSERAHSPGTLATRGFPQCSGYPPRVKNPSIADAHQVPTRSPRPISAAMSRNIWLLGARSLSLQTVSLRAKDGTIQLSSAISDGLSVHPSGENDGRRLWRWLGFQDGFGRRHRSLPRLRGYGFGLCQIGRHDPSSARLRRI